MRTRFPERSTSVMESLLERDMIAIDDLPVFFERFFSYKIVRDFVCALRMMSEKKGRKRGLKLLPLQVA
jgi:hypothetical protein